jgi:hypothetical protein
MEEYRRWGRGFAGKLYLAGTVWFAAAGSWYTMLAWPDEIQTAMFRGPWAALTIPTALLPGLPLLLMFLWYKDKLTRASAALVGATHLLILALNATSRQVVQNLNLERYVDLTASGSDVQWSPLIGFLALFVLGAGVIGWMVAQVLKASPDASE